MFNDEIIYYISYANVASRLIIETLVEERNHLSPLCAVGKSITQLERFEKVVMELLGDELSEEKNKARLVDLDAAWRNVKLGYSSKVDAPTPPALLFLSAATSSSLFAISSVAAKIGQHNNAAANDVINYAKLTFEEVLIEIEKAGQAYFSR
jgi:hypothetical protein